MYEEYHRQIQDEALQAYPQEAVWAITREGCRRLQNVHPTPEEAFSVTGEEMLRVRQEGLLALVHSHPDKPQCPSEADMQGQIDSAVPWGIVCTDGNRTAPIFFWGDDAPIPPLRGRPYRHGVTDCYSVIRDYYRTEHGILLPEFPRSWDWWHHGENLYENGFKKAGFRRFDNDVERPKAGDMWFSQLRSKVPNHGGIYLGKELILHHPASRYAYEPSRISRREPIHRWMPYITHWLRHEDLEE